MNNSGGVLHLEEQSKAIVGKSIFQQNKAEHHGGVISASAMSQVSITDSTFFHNSADKGAVLRAKQESSISFDVFFVSWTDINTGQNLMVESNDEIQIYNNTATESGGGIHLSESDLYFGTDLSLIHI